MTAAFAMALLGAVTFMAIVVASVAIVRARNAGAALRASEQSHAESAELARKMEAGSRRAGDVAHDVNDLMTAIAGHTELLIAGLDPSSTSIQDAHEIRRAALSAARLTKPLRALGGGHGSTEVIDVNAVTVRTVAALQRMLGASIEVTLDLDDDIKRIRIGASQLEEILLNLGIHARDAMPNGGRLTVATAMHTSDARQIAGGPSREYVQMLLTDSGGGISAAAQAKLFEPFFGSEGGTGNAVGLAKVDAIVKQAGGRIQVRSAAGLGTTFTVDLPATSELAAVPYAPFAAAPVTGPVLVVEDEPHLRELIKVVLGRAGHEVLAVAGPHDALVTLNRQPALPLMLVDVVMPEMSGYDLVVEARKIAPDVHVVFMSAFACDKSRHPGGDGFLAKPFTIGVLTRVVEEALHETGRR